jgi:hypothetical protein
MSNLDRQTMNSSLNGLPALPLLNMQIASSNASSVLDAANLYQNSVGYFRVSLLFQHRAYPLS